MTSVNSTKSTTNDQPSFSCARAQSHESRAAIATLILGEPLPEDPRVDQMIAYATAANYSLKNLWIAKDPQNAILSALLMIPTPGGAGMIFLSPTASADQTPILQALTQAMLAAQPRASANTLYQSLIELNQTHQQTALLAAGFSHLALLNYMQIRLGYASPPSTSQFTQQNIQTHTYSDQSHPLFERAIQDSYIDTLDCPGLLGKRSIQNVIAGHKATGDFDPNLWHVFTQDQSPIAVMLISKLGKNQTAELVYLGIAPSHRNKGLAKQFLSFGMQLASYEAQRKLITAVDNNNVPAVKLYKSLGFIQTGAKNALIYTEKTD
ncbi:GNAT family N-acetyltransferase [Poriferisphaera corsica]|nr:GNAT family N-acetyltransferase [Poriferisphaera corsica]